MKAILIKRFALLGLLALSAVSCFDIFNGPRGRYESYMQIRYEPQSYSELQEFLDNIFNGGKDSVAVRDSFFYGPVSHYAKQSADKKRFGGFAMCIGVDTLVGPDRTPVPAAVFDKGGNDGSLGYAVFHDTTSVLMPDHDILVYIPNDESSASPYNVFVQNTHAVVEAVKYGVGLADGPFRENDWMDLTFKAFFKGKPAGEKKVHLVNGTHLLEGWTEVDLSAMSLSDELKLSITCSRPDMPLYVALDDLCIHYLEIY